MGKIVFTNVGCTFAGRDNFSIEGYDDVSFDGVVAHGAGRDNFNISGPESFLDKTGFKGNIPDDVVKAFLVSLRQEAKADEVTELLIVRAAKAVGIDRLLSERNIALASFAVAVMAYVKGGG